MLADTNTASTVFTTGRFFGVGSRRLLPALLACLALSLAACSSGGTQTFAEWSATRTPEQERRVQDNLRALDEHLRRQVALQVVPGAAVSIYYGDDVLYRKAYRQDLNRPYAILSFTKTFTALAVIRLAEAGKLRLDDSASAILGAGVEDSAFRDRAITVRHLLTHSSGIPDSGAQRRLEVYPSIYIPRQNYAAGERFQYSNPGYRLLGMIVEKASGQSVQSFITEQLLVPLEMRNTRFSIRSNGASGMVSSLVDLTNYVELYVNRGKFRGRRIISDANFDQLFSTPAARAHCEYAEYRGIAWRIQTYQDRVFMMNHAALGAGMGGLMQIFPEHRIGFVFLSNPETYNTDQFIGFYRDLRRRLNEFAADAGDMEFTAASSTPCALHTVPW